MSGGELEDRTSVLFFFIHVLLPASPKQNLLIKFDVFPMRIEQN